MTSTPTRHVDNVVIATKGLQDRNINVIAGTTVENKGKLILTDHIYIVFCLTGILESSSPSMCSMKCKRKIWKGEKILKKANYSATFLL